MNRIVLFSRSLSQWNRVPSILAAKHFDHHQRRDLMTDEVLGMDRFVNFRNRTQSLFGSYKEKFIERLQEHVNQDGNNILSEDLKNLIALCDDNPQELELLKKTIEKFEDQNQSLRFGTFQFGPVVMRLAHHLNKPEFASEIMNKKLLKFYNQLSSVTIAMNLLFKNGQYEEVIQLYNFVNKNYHFDPKYPADMVTLYIAACYKINTPEAFDETFKLLREVKLSKNVIKFRSLCLFITLAIQQGHPNIVLEMLQQLNFKSYPTILQSLRLWAFSEINHYHELFRIINFHLKKDKARNTSKLVHQDVLDKIHASLRETNKEERIKEFELMLKNLHESNLVEKDVTLEQMLMSPIVQKRDGGEDKEDQLGGRATVVKFGNRGAVSQAN